MSRSHLDFTQANSMMTLLIEHVRIAVPQDPIGEGWLWCQDGLIAAFGDRTTPAPAADTRINGAGCLLLPGFIDLHVHGGGGHEVMDAQHGTLPALSAFYAQHGVTGFLATTWTDTPERITAALNMVRRAPPELPGAQLLGVHLEGPFLNVEKCGAQNPELIRTASPAEVLPYLDSGLIRLVAIAPEIQANRWLIEACIARGITVSAAHTSATYDDMLEAVALGITQTTHTFNAMTGLHHREPGVVGAALALDELRCELIADNIHVHPGAMRALFNAKGVHGIILITDAVRPAGLPDGDYPIDDRIITVQGGAARLPDGTLAGSLLTMERGLHNFARATGKPLESLWPVSSLNAAQAIGTSETKGSIEVGKNADLVLLNDEAHVLLTISRGRVVYDSGVLHVQA